MNRLKRKIDLSLFKKVLTALICKVLGGTATFIASVIIARSFGATESGVYFLAFSIVTLFSAFGRLGLDGASLRYISSGGYDPKGVLQKTLPVTFFCGTIIASLIYVNANFLAENVFKNILLIETLKAISPSVIFLSLNAVVSASLQAQKHVATSIFILNIGINLFLLLLLATNNDFTVVNLAHLFTFSSFIVFIIGITALSLIKTKSATTILSWRSIYESGLPLCVVAISNQSVQWAGQIIAGAYLSSELVSQLSVAQRTAMLTSFILMAVNWVIAPKLSNLFYNKELQELQLLTIRVVRWLFILSMPIGLVIFFFSESIMELFGNGFEASANLLIILALGQLVNVVTGPAIQILTMTGNERDVSKVSVISMVFSVFLGFIFTYFFGVYGSAFSTAFSVALYNLLAVYYVKVRLGFSIYRKAIGLV